jgi:hypothetical protein
MKAFLYAASAIMCFCTLSVRAATNLNIVGTYTLEDYLNGGFIDGDDLYIIRSGTYPIVDGLTFYRIPLTRNTTSGRIIGMDDSAITTLTAYDYMDSFSPKGPGGYYFYGTTKSSSETKPYYPNGTGVGSVDSSTKTFTKASDITPATYDSLNTYYTGAGAGIKFEGLFSYGFSPVVTDPGTNFGIMTGVAPSGFWQVSMTASGSTFTPTKATFLCALPTEFPGGSIFVPSGTYKNSALVISWSNLQKYESGEDKDSTIQILQLDSTNGYCIDSTSNTAVLGTQSPKLVDVISGFSEYPQGFILDPKTNDLLVTFYSSNIIQFAGFPPGLDFGVGRWKREYYADQCNKNTNCHSS